MKKFFEYMYYRMAKLSPKKQYQDAALPISVCQVLLIFNLYFFLIIGPFNITGKLTSVEAIVMMLVLVGLGFYNQKLYAGRFEEFDKKWGNETTTQKILGMIVIFLFVCFCWFAGFIIAWIYGRI